MSVPNDTQTIDADALRARLAEATAGLRERIAAALRARHGANASVDLGPAPDGFIGRDAVAFVMGGYVAVRADDDGAALRGLASFVGLNADGSDPRDEIARLRAGLEVAQTSLAAATSGRRVTACDEVERLQRENATLRAAYVADLDGLRAEVRRADIERAAWRDLRDAAREYLDAVADIERAVTGPRMGVVIDSAAMISRRNEARTRLAALMGGAR